MADSFMKNDLILLMLYTTLILNFNIEQPRWLMFMGLEIITIGEITCLLFAETTSLMVMITTEEEF